MLNRLLILLGNPPECDMETVEVCREMAERSVLDYIGREELPRGADCIVDKLAVIYYNRLGNEGETARTEGGISQSFNSDIPMDILRQLRNYPRKVGVIHSETVEE